MSSSRTDLIEKGARALHEDYVKRATPFAIGNYPLSWDDARELHERDAEIVLVACGVIDDA